jgi:tetratricopeptide (TPR) repeat protein
MGMTTISAEKFVRFAVGCLSLLAIQSHAAQTADAITAQAIPTLLFIEPLETTSLDAQIRTSQRRLKNSALPAAELERLGWLFVAKARATSDPGFHTIAAIAADALEKEFGHKNEARLLRGHVMQTRHRFAEAEEIGRQLVAERSAPGDYALLGDALYDQGRITEAAEAYQQMVHLKPGLDSYARAANIRWIKGDLVGAIELQSLAVRSGGPGDAGALAWSLVRLGQLVWQQGNAEQANELASRALLLVPEFQPALLLTGRLLLASNRPVDALGPLERAAEILPLPEPRWIHAEALRAAGRLNEAAALEDRLVREGMAEDPRTVALFLATHGRDPGVAVKLVSDELKHRTDVTTIGTRGLALSRAGRIDQAVTEARASLREGTVDARLLLHAGRTAALARQPEAAELLARAGRLTPLLLPSERRLLEDSLTLLPEGSDQTGNTHETHHPKTS